MNDSIERTDLGDEPLEPPVLPTTHLGDPVVVRTAAEHRTRTRRSFLTGVLGAAVGWRYAQRDPEWKRLAITGTDQSAYLCGRRVLCLAE